MTRILQRAIEEYENRVLPLYDAEGVCEPDREAEQITLFRELLQEPFCFSRRNQRAHFTASAFVLDRNWSRVVLTLHKKLGKWLQLGGHSDGNPDLGSVAIKEVREESGLSQLIPFDWDKRKFEDPSSSTLLVPFDLDIHDIPARKNEPRHWHYDARFLFFTDEQRLTISDESDDLRWISLSGEGSEYPDEDSMQRLRRKALWLKGFTAG